MVGSMTENESRARMVRSSAEHRSVLLWFSTGDAEHKREVQLGADEWLALVTWVDLNAQYWGTFVEFAVPREKGIPYA